MIVLKPCTESDFPVIVEWVNVHDSDFLVQWAGLTYEYPLTVEKMQMYYRNGINSMDSGAFLNMIYFEDSVDEPVGTFQLARFDMVKKEAVVGRFMLKSEAIRGRGLGRAALEEMVRLGFEQFGLNRIKLNVFDFNERAIRCYERVGFLRGKITENVFRSSKGSMWSNMEMVLEKRHWEELNLTYEKDGH